jgi:hypothetical protein
MVKKKKPKPPPPAPGFNPLVPDAHLPGPGKRKAEDDPEREEKKQRVE